MFFPSFLIPVFVLFDTSRVVFSFVIIDYSVLRQILLKACNTVRCVFVCMDLVASADEWPGNSTEYYLLSRLNRGCCGLVRPCSTCPLQILTSIFAGEEAEPCSCNAQVWLSETPNGSSAAMATVPTSGPRAFGWF